MTFLHLAFKLLLLLESLKLGRGRLHMQKLLSRIREQVEICIKTEVKKNSDSSF